MTMNTKQTDTATDEPQELERISVCITTDWDCENCGEHHTEDGDMRGEVLTCPSCNTSFQTNY